MLQTREQARKCGSNEEEEEEAYRESRTEVEAEKNKRRTQQIHDYGLVGCDTV
jgi:hypothetical protein